MAGPRDEDTAELPAWTTPEGRWQRGASSLVEVDVAALTHRGTVRALNEDHYHLGRFERRMRTLSTNMPEGEIPPEYEEVAYGMLVADGVGGSSAGEVASRTAIRALVDLVLDTPDWIMPLDEGLSRAVLQRMERRFQRIREILVEQADADPTLRGMATTLTLACSLGAELLTAHVGDSRAYVFRDGKLQRLTRDQTMAQSLADAGAITEEEAAHHPGRHMLTGALATRGAFVQVELGRSRIVDGDQILLCSDGLTEMATEDAIARVLAKSRNATEACQALVDLALEGGGKDNVTVILGRYHIPETVLAR